MIYAVQFVMCALFVELVIQLRVGDTVKSIFTLSQDAIGYVSSKKLTDDEKEKLIRKTSFEMFKLTLAFISKFAAIVLGLYIAYQLLKQILPFSEALFIESIYSVKVIVLLTLAAIFYHRLRNVVVQRLHSD